MISPSTSLQLRPLLVLNVTVGTLVDAGGPPGARRRIGSIDGGTFGGDRLNGTVVPGGADWQTVRGDGAVLLDARALLHSDDGATIAITYTGIRHGSADVMARLGRGEEVDPASYYFRIVPRFDTSAARYEWLNRIVAVGTGVRLPQGPVYWISEIV
ncbi:phosphoserine aminotransferase [Devosia insulae DS-56]|uniref:UPF0311 protein VW23_019805 n=1 Tax=Devosia insulae DS-56 TaxID=1116389 RepID=A0A1E5XQG1_9HYPH|nr:DUF3237 domain-containing protein [Devosia insulae]OEO30744.1 phosphoserine aminotransferase [Devosia insulae DS-56]